MSRKYWLDLFTGKTWEEFLKAGSDVSGFRYRKRKIAGRIKPGDYLICYLTGISRFIGVLEVKSESYQDNTPIWGDEDFPIRFKVELVHKLKPETAIPVLSLKDKLTIFEGLKTKHAWTGFFRGSPNLFEDRDGEIITEAIKEAQVRPIEKEYDEKKYWRSPRTFETKEAIVTIPEADEREVENVIKEDSATTHEEIQWLLLNLGSDMGLDVWVARNDKGRSYNGKAFQEIKQLKDTLPRQFDEATNHTIEMIDVLWLQRDAIIAAFEVEHSTSIYSGLLRMADLVSMQPNIKINLYIVAPDERRDKVVSEINRPTFARLRPGLPKICKFISYSDLKQELEEIGTRIKYMNHDFIDEIAESCEIEEV